MDKIIKEQIDQILSSGEFAEPGNTGILDRIGEYIKNALDSIKDWLNMLQMPDIKGNYFEGQNLQRGFPALKFMGIIIVAAIVISVAVVLYKNLRTLRAVKEKEDALILRILKDSDTAEAKALAFFNGGEYGQGLRFLYLSLLLKLNELNIIRIDKSKTNNQYLKEAYISAFSGYDMVYEFTKAFNECWYGGKNASRESFEYWHNQYCLLAEGRSI